MSMDEIPFCGLQTRRQTHLYRSLHKTGRNGTLFMDTPPNMNLKQLLGLAKELKSWSRLVRQTFPATTNNKAFNKNTTKADRRRQPPRKCKQPAQSLAKPPGPTTRKQPDQIAAKNWDEILDPKKIKKQKRKKKKKKMKPWSRKTKEEFWRQHQEIKDSTPPSPTAKKPWT